jgi:hypothetical protein
MPPTSLVAQSLRLFTCKNNQRSMRKNHLSSQMHSSTKIMGRERLAAMNLTIRMEIQFENELHGEQSFGIRL